MSKGIILYRSKYGATAKYAAWLQEKTGFDLIETKKADVRSVQKYDTVILGGGVYASGIAGLSFIKKNIDSLAGKKMAVFCVCASPYDENAFEQIRQLHFKDKLADIPLFYCRGAFDLEKMTVVDRTLCRMLQKATANKEPSAYEPWEKALMSAIDEKCDWTDPKYLEPIMDYLDKN